MLCCFLCGSCICFFLYKTAQLALRNSVSAVTVAWSLNLCELVYKLMVKESLGYIFAGDSMDALQFLFVMTQLTPKFITIEGQTY